LFPNPFEIQETKDLKSMQTDWLLEVGFVLKIVVERWIGMTQIVGTFLIPVESADLGTILVVVAIILMSVEIPFAMIPAMFVVTLLMFVETLLVEIPVSVVVVILQVMMPVEILFVMLQVAIILMTVDPVPIPVDLAVLVVTVFVSIPVEVESIPTFVVDPAFVTILVDFAWFQMFVKPVMATFHLSIVETSVTIA
jgi:hypothetical protein